MKKSFLFLFAVLVTISSMGTNKEKQAKNRSDTAFRLKACFETSIEIGQEDTLNSYRHFYDCFSKQYKIKSFPLPNEKTVYGVSKETLFKEIVFKNKIPFRLTLDSMYYLNQTGDSILVYTTVYYDRYRSMGQKAVEAMLDIDGSPTKHCILFKMARENPDLDNYVIKQIKVINPFRFYLLF